MTAPTTSAPRDAPEATAALGRAEEALARVDALPDEARQVTAEALEAVVAVYARGLERLVELVAGRAPDLAADLAADDLVAHLLLLHGLHPDPTEVRVVRALAAIAPQLEGLGGGAELVAIEAGTARIQLRAGGGCGSSVAGLRAAVDEAVLAAAPELVGVRALDPPPATAFVPLTSLTRRADGASRR